MAYQIFLHKISHAPLACRTLNIAFAPRSNIYRIIKGLQINSSQNVQLSSIQIVIACLIVSHTSAIGISFATVLFLFIKYDDK